MADAKQIEDKSKDPVDELAGSEAPLLEHLVELRKRLIYSAITLVVLTFAAFAFSRDIYSLLVRPYFNSVKDAELIAIAPQEQFFTYLNVSLFTAVFVGFPMIAAQIYMFVAPGLYKHERRAFLPYLVATPVLFFLGGCLVYFAVLPMALHFFANMQTDEIKLMVSVSEYLGFAMTLILAFGVCFQLPVVLTLLAQIDLVQVDMLKKGRRYAIVGILIFAAFITPPDPISQIGLAVPMYLLYELSIISVRLVERRRAAALAAQEAELSGSSTSD